MTTIPFAIKTRLLTPVITRRLPTALDGLVYHALFMHLGSEDTARRALTSIFKTTQGVPHASGHLFGVSDSQTLNVAEWPTIGAMRTYGDYGIDKVAPNGAKGRYKKLEVNGGAFMIRMDTHPAIASDYLLFFGLGDGQRVVDLLNFYALGIGGEAQRGAGQCQRFELVEIKDDCSLALEGEPNRVLPVELAEIVLPGAPGLICQNYQLIDAQLMAPYQRDGESVKCIAPDPVRSMHLSQLNERSIL